MHFYLLDNVLMWYRENTLKSSFVFVVSSGNRRKRVQRAVFCRCLSVKWLEAALRAYNQHVS